MNQWISVEDRLPDDNATVLATNGRWTDVDRRLDGNWEFPMCWTHWMPIPELPG